MSGCSFAAFPLYTFFFFFLVNREIEGAASEEFDTKRVFRAKDLGFAPFNEDV